MNINKTQVKNGLRVLTKPQADKIISNIRRVLIDMKKQNTGEITRLNPMQVDTFERRCGW